MKIFFIGRGDTSKPSNGKVRGASPLAGEASSREAATSTVVLERKEAE